MSFQDDLLIACIASIPITYITIILFPFSLYLYSVTGIIGILLFARYMTLFNKYGILDIFNKENGHPTKIGEYIIFTVEGKSVIVKYEKERRREFIGKRVFIVHGSTRKEIIPFPGVEIAIPRSTEISPHIDVI